MKSARQVSKDPWWKRPVAGVCVCVAAVDRRHADWEATAKATLNRALKTPININVARNVILFIGDGMGVATVTAGRIYAAQQQGLRYGEESSLAFERFPHVGLSKVKVKSELCGSDLRFYSPRPDTRLYYVYIAWCIYSLRLRRRDGQAELTCVASYTEMVHPDSYPSQY